MSGDLDQGGTFREWVRTYCGPSLGWVMFLVGATKDIIAAGTTNIASGTTLVRVNVAGAVTVQLPTAIVPSPPITTPPTAITGQPITIVDVGGHASTFNITILPFGTETIMGLASLTIANDYGAFVLTPDTVNGGWTNV